MSDVKIKVVTFENILNDSSIFDTGIISDKDMVVFLERVSVLTSNNKILLSIIESNLHSINNHKAKIEKLEKICEQNAETNKALLELITKLTSNGNNGNNGNNSGNNSGSNTGNSGQDNSGNSNNNNNSSGGTGFLNPVEEYEWILANIKTESQLYSTYNKSNKNRRGYRTQDIANFEQIKSNIYRSSGRVLSKRDMVKNIFEKISSKLKS